MNTETFIIEILKAVAWPLTIVLIVLILKRPIVQLFPSLQKMKFKDFELEFNKEVQQLSNETMRTSPDIFNFNQTNIFDNDFNNAIQYSPREEIIKAWIKLEDSARGALKKQNVKLSRLDYSSPLHLANRLRENKLLDSSKIGIFNNLRNLRNEAAHSYRFNIMPESAREYINIADSLMHYLDNVQGQAE